MDFRALTNRVLKAATSTFGEEVKFLPAAGGIILIRAIFKNDYRTMDLDTEQPISVNQPALGINLNDWPELLVNKDQVEVRGVQYRIVDKQEDGQGGATLMLNKVRKGDFIRETRQTY